MLTLKEICGQLYEYHRGGWYNLHSYHRPVVPIELADEKDEWYVIRLPHALWVLRTSDIPRRDFAYRDVTNKVLVRIVKKTAVEFYLEEEWERKRMQIRFGEAEV